MTRGERADGVEIRRASRGDAGAVIEVMSAAFREDPVAKFLQPKESNRSLGIASFTKMTVRLPPERREIYLADGASAAAIWSPPDQWRLSLWESRPFLLRTLRTPSRLAIALRFFARADAMHPAEPHWYLDLVGTRPEQQGKGIGEALLRPVLDRCDEQGLPVWTYSSNRQNLAFYHRLGFEVVDEVVLVEGAPPVFPIYRRARS